MREMLWAVMAVLFLLAAVSMMAVVNFNQIASRRAQVFRRRTSCILSRHQEPRWPLTDIVVVKTIPGYLHWSKHI